MLGDHKAAQGGLLGDETGTIKRLLGDHKAAQGGLLGDHNATMNGLITEGE